LRTYLTVFKGHSRTSYWMLVR